MYCVLWLYRGQSEYVPEHPLGHGIGELEFEEERREPDTYAHLHGWWWMPEAHYEEIWMQVREHTYTSCAVEIDIAPIDFSDGPQWDVGQRKILSVLRASVGFNRRSPVTTGQ